MQKSIKLNVGWSQVPQIIKINIMSNKIKIFLAICFVGMISFFYVYKAYTRKIPSLRNLTTAYNIIDSSLINEFINNEQQANSKYLDKIISVTGRVKQIDRDGGNIIIALGSENYSSSVKCAMDRSEKKTDIRLSDTITLKGACIGFNKDDIIGSDVILNRCILINQ